MSTDNILYIVIKALNEENFELLAILLSITFFIWSYIEFRKNYINVKLENKLDINKALEYYSKLYLEIQSYLNGSINFAELINYFSVAIVYLPRSIVKEILELDKNKLESRTTDLEHIKELVSSEILSIKYKQNIITTLDYKDNILEQTSWSFSSNNFDSFINPLFYSFFAFIGSFFLVTIGFVISDLPGYAKLSFMMFLINSILSIMILIHLIDLGINKKIKVQAYLFFVLLVILPFFLVTFILNIKFSIVNTISIILFLYITKKLLKQSEIDK